MTDSHLDDTELSALLDGIDVDGRAHVHGEAECPTCAARLTALRDARDAVAAAVVVPLPAAALDRLVGAALDAPMGGDVVAFDSARRRPRLTAPPPAWLIGAAAGIAVLVGVAGVFRAIDLSGGDGSGLASITADEEAANDGGESAGRQLPAAGTATAGSLPVDPEVVVGDLAEVNDPAALTLALDGLRLTPSEALSSTSSSAAGGGAPTAGAASTPTAAAEAATDKNAAGPPPPTTTTPVDRAQCRARAEAIGSGRFAALLSTATLRWKGAPAEVLVFRLAEPSSPDSAETRQALVLSRPGCELLADPRF